jgi:quercetin dioxygenase-like cupin family protein
VIYITSRVKYIVQCAFYCSPLHFISLIYPLLEATEIEKAKVFIIVEIIEYVPNSVVIRTIIRKTTGNVSAVSFDSGEVLTEKISPFDTFIQIIDGKAEILINDIPSLLETGQSIIIPAHTRNTIKANVRFKMLSTIIKSGFEELS